MALKIFVFLFVFSIVFIFKEATQFIMALRNEEIASRYEINKYRLLGLGMSLSYIITILITGFRL